MKEVFGFVLYLFIVWVVVVLLLIAFAFLMLIVSKAFGFYNAICPFMNKYWLPVMEYVTFRKPLIKRK